MGTRTGRFIVGSMQSRIREWMHGHGAPTTAHEIGAALGLSSEKVSQVLANMVGQGYLTREPIERTGRRYTYRLVEGVDLPAVAGPRFNPEAGLPKPYTPPPAPPRRPVMTAPSLSKLQHDAAVAKAAAEAPAVDAVAHSAPADTASVPEPITSAAALQRLERTLELPRPAGAPAPVAPLPAEQLTGARPDPVVIDDPRPGPSASVQALMAEQLEQILGPVPEAPSPSSETTDNSAPSLRCALRSDGCLCIEFTESDEAFWLTRAETRVLADYLLSFRVEPLEKLTCA